MSVYEHVCVEGYACVINERKTGGLLLVEPIFPQESLEL